MEEAERLEGQLSLGADQPKHSNKHDDNDTGKRRRFVDIVSDPSLVPILVLFLLIVLVLCGHGLAFHHTFTVESSHNDVLSKEAQQPSFVEYLEEIPDHPKLRDMDEYVLSDGWDFSHGPTTREYSWTITDTELNPDGIYRPMMLINNQFPGPLVRCNDGDRLLIHVQNQATNATAIHFHGMFQNGTNAMDGTVGITQCAIAPNTSFTYDFHVKGQSGTYWYHAHHSAQASDGLLGPMVVHSMEERRQAASLNTATDRVIMVQDHYHNTTSELLMEYLQPDMENSEPVPDNALINGRGFRDCDDFPGWRCNNTTDRPALPVVLNLEEGKRHRLRIINVGAFAEFQIQFDEHPFYVTEVDGTDVHPEPFHRLNILPAQRYSVVLETNVSTETTDSFWIRARMLTHCFTAENERLEPEIRAVIQYGASTEKIKEPTSKDWPEAIEVVCRDLNTSVLHPVDPVDPPPADAFIDLRANFMIRDWALARGYFNDSTWHANVTHPSLHRFLESNFNATSLDTAIPISTNADVFDAEKDFVLQTSGIRTIDISINNFDDGAHPFHLHGHKFFVLVQGQSGYPPKPEELPAYLEEHGLTRNPLRRDTVTVEGYGWAIIRVTLDNPGLWAFHCHNTWHAESGMVMQFLVRPEEVSKWELDPSLKAMCGMEGVTKGVRPADSLWYGWF
jgi:FtsP/CotA-like multicopper oxidase with cupredoxin domain